MTSQSWKFYFYLVNLDVLTMNCCIFYTSWGSFTIYVYIFLPFFDHLPTPSLQSFTFDQPPTYCKYLHLTVDHPKEQNNIYMPQFAWNCFLISISDPIIMYSLVQSCHVSSNKVIFKVESKRLLCMAQKLNFYRPNFFCKRLQGSDHLLNPCLHSFTFALPPTHLKL